jgi:hypothetical protein
MVARRRRRSENPYRNISVAAGLFVADNIRARTAEMRANIEGPAEPAVPTEDARLQKISDLIASLSSIVIATKRATWSS